MKVGIAGTGLMGYTHAQCYSKLSDIELYAVAEQNTNKRNEFRKIYPAVKTYEDIYEMINDDSIDIIDICLPTPLHAPSAISALNKNRHVLLEKPIALNLKDAYAIKEASEKSKGKFMVAHVLRFWPEYITIRKTMTEFMTDEQITAIYASRFNELPLWSENSWIMNEEKSGGLVIDLMIHDIDFLIWNMGKVRRVLSNAIYNENNYAIQVMAILEMENGSTAYVDGGYLNPAGVGLTSQMHIYSTNYILEMYSNKNNIKLTQKNKPIKEITVSSFNAYLEEIKYFIHCIKQDKSPEIITVLDAIESLKTCLALKNSLLQKRWLTINQEQQN